MSGLNDNFGESSSRAARTTTRGTNADAIERTRTPTTPVAPIPAVDRRELRARKIREKNERDEARATATRKLLEDNENAIIDNPLAHLRDDRELTERVEELFARWQFAKYALDINLFQRAALVARRPQHYASLRLPADEERVFRLEESASFWDETHIRVPIAMCCIAGVVQGWTQSSANAANLYYPKALGMTGPDGIITETSQQWLFNGQNAALFLSGALAGCFLTDPLNEWLYGRRGAILIAALFTFVGVIGTAFSQTKWEFLVFRIILGLGMGAKASVVPIYAAEISPAKLRGRLVINWQVFTALGIFLSFTANLIFARDEEDGWRLMFGSGVVPTVFLICIVFCCPESPRYLMKRGLYIEAYRAFLRLRGTPIAAAKEMIYLDSQLQAAEAQLIKKRIRHRDDEETNAVPMTQVRTGSLDEEDEFDSEEEDDGKPTVYVDGPRGFRQRLTAWWRRMWQGEEEMNGTNSARKDPFVLQFRDTNYMKRLWNLVGHPRIARASLAAATVMISQQLCGINILAFYSSSLFYNSTTSRSLTPLWYSWGFGITNFLFSFPAYFLVDRKGRRWLLLWTFPLMASCLLITGLVYNHSPEASYAFIIVFTAFYSFGGGPVPFAYSAEVYPLTNREAGMSFAVFWNFLGAGLLLLLVPQLLPQPRVLLGVFTGLCMLAWIFLYLFMPETKEKTLEEINYISISKSYQIISNDLQGMNADRYGCNITGGTQELIEAISFEHYLETQSLITYAQTVAKVAPMGGSNTPIPVTKTDYILGIYDFTGELMKFAVTAMAMTGEVPTTTVVEGDMEVGSRRNVLDDLRELRALLQGLTGNTSGLLAKDVGKKMEVMQASVQKVENALYGLIVRGAERPKGWMPEERAGGTEVDA